MDFLWKKTKSGGTAEVIEHICPEAGRLLGRCFFMRRGDRHMSAQEWDDWQEVRNNTGEK